MQQTQNGTHQQNFQNLLTSNTNTNNVESIWYFLFIDVTMHPNMGKQNVSSSNATIALLRSLQCNDPFNFWYSQQTKTKKNNCLQNNFPLKEITKWLFSLQISERFVGKMTIPPSKIKQLVAKMIILLTIKDKTIGCQNDYSFDNQR